MIPLPDLNTSDFEVGERTLEVKTSYISELSRLLHTILFKYRPLLNGEESEESLE